MIDDDFKLSPPSPLSVATNEELIQELKSRHAAVLVCILYRTEDHSTDYSYSGGFHNALGLAQHAAYRLLNGEDDGV